MAVDQTYANHRRIVPAYHGLAFLCTAAFLGLAVWSAVKHPGVVSIMLVVLGVGVVLLFWYARAFVLTVQDRVIRLEQRLRLERLLPPDLRARIGEFRLGQLIALRFASDGELPALARRVLEEDLRDREAIKRLITESRPDHLRV